MSAIIHGNDFENPNSLVLKVCLTTDYIRIDHPKLRRVLWRWDDEAGYKRACSCDVEVPVFPPLNCSHRMRGQFKVINQLNRTSRIELEGCKEYLDFKSGILKKCGGMIRQMRKNLNLRTETLVSILHQFDFVDIVEACEDIDSDEYRSWMSSIWKFIREWMTGFDVSLKNSSNLSQNSLNGLSTTENKENLIKSFVLLHVVEFYALFSLIDWSEETDLETGSIGSNSHDLFITDCVVPSHLVAVKVQGSKNMNEAISSSCLNLLTELFQELDKHRLSEQSVVKNDWSKIISRMNTNYEEWTGYQNDESFSSMLSSLGAQDGISIQLRLRRIQTFVKRVLFNSVAPGPQSSRLDLLMVALELIFPLYSISDYYLDTGGHFIDFVSLNSSAKDFSDIHGSRRKLQKMSCSSLLSMMDVEPPVYHTTARLHISMIRPELEAMSDEAKNHIDDKTGRIMVIRQALVIICATHIQRIWRGVIGRRMAIIWKANIISLRQHRAATMFESVWRSYAIRQIVNEDIIRLKIRSSIVIQSGIRKYLAIERVEQRRHVYQTQLEYDSAVVLESYCRMLNARWLRKQLTQAKEDERTRQKRNHAAIVIQCLARRKMARRSVRVVKLLRRMDKGLLQTVERFLQSSDIWGLIERVSDEREITRLQLETMKKVEEENALTFIDSVVQARQKQYNKAWDAFIEATGSSFLTDVPGPRLRQALTNAVRQETAQRGPESKNDGNTSNTSSSSMKKSKSPTRAEIDSDLASSVKTQPPSSPIAAGSSDGSSLDGQFGETLDVYNWKKEHATIPSSSTASLLSSPGSVRSKAVTRSDATTRGKILPKLPPAGPAVFRGESLVADIPLGLDDAIDKLLVATAIRCKVPCFAETNRTSKDNYMGLLNCESKLARSKYDFECHSTCTALISRLHQAYHYYSIRDALPLSNLRNSLREVGCHEDFINAMSTIVNETQRQSTTCHAEKGICKTEAGLMTRAGQSRVEKKQTHIFIEESVQSEIDRICRDLVSDLKRHCQDGSINLQELVVQCLFLSISDDKIQSYLDYLPRNASTILKLNQNEKAAILCNWSWRERLRPVNRRVWEFFAEIWRIWSESGEEASVVWNQSRVCQEMCQARIQRSVLQCAPIIQTLAAKDYRTIADLTRHWHDLCRTSLLQVDYAVIDRVEEILGIETINAQTVTAPDNDSTGSSVSVSSDVPTMMTGEINLPGASDWTSLPQDFKAPKKNPATGRYHCTKPNCSESFNQMGSWHKHQQTHEKFVQYSQWKKDKQVGFDR